VCDGRFVPPLGGVLSVDLSPTDAEDPSGSSASPEPVSPTSGGRVIDAIIYEELRGLAAAYMRTQAPGHTLQPTALVSEAYLKIAKSSPQALTSRAHFLAVAAKAMRHVLINHAIARKTAKRGGGAARVDLDLSGIGSNDDGDHVEALAVNEALKVLEELDPRRARVVEGKVFAGMTNQEIAEVLGISTTTVESDWRTARAWLTKEMRPGR
jgi:RNA polymerase sigma-70 factor, ECF subfamily